MASIPKVISGLIGGYLNDSQETAILAKAEPHADTVNLAWTDQIRFFDSLRLREDKLKNALGQALIYGNIPVAEVLLANNPWLFDSRVSGVDPCGRRLTEKLIAFVARLYRACYGMCAVQSIIRNIP